MEDDDWWPDPYELERKSERSYWKQRIGGCELRDENGPGAEECENCSHYKECVEMKMDE